LSINDNGNTGSGGAQIASASSTINITAVNDAPVNTVPGAQSTAMNTPITFSGANLISVADVDANGGLEQITLSVSHGTLNLSGTAGLTLVAGANASASMSYQGTLVNLDAALNGLTYTPASNYSGADTLSIVTNDLGNTGTGGPLTTSSAIAMTIPLGAGGPVIAPPPIVLPPPTPNPVLVLPPPAPPASPPTQPAVTPPLVLSGGRPMVAEAVTDELPASSGGVQRFLVASKLRANHNPAPILKPAELTMLVEGSEPHYVEFGPTTKADWSAQTAFPGHHGSEHDQIDVIMESVRMGGIALSVGVVWWASRVSGLIGSLLASMPAWRHLDPLPIVGKDEEKDEERWYEPEDSEADADELAISMVLDGPRSRDAVNA
jgi:hypothetical protein